MDKLQHKLKNLPALHGVYIMKDPQDNVIYVGKSKLLKNRIRQYFNNTNHNPKVAAMVDAIADFEYIVTDTELEALVLECNLIKKYKPYYNILLKDSKQYPYIKLTMKEEYPRIVLARSAYKDGNLYFGPYSGNTVRETMEILKKVFKIRTCNRVFPRDIGKGRPCLNYHIKMCKAPCMGIISRQEYLASFDGIISFLEGKETELIDKMQKDMEIAAGELRFEEAASLRDKIQILSNATKKQKINVPDGTDKDVIALKTDEINSNIQVMNICKGKLLGREQIWLECIVEQDESEILSQFMKQYYMNDQYIPKEILVNIIPDDVDTLQQWLSSINGSKITIKAPARGITKDIVNMAEKNAVTAINERAKNTMQDKSRNFAALSELADALGLKVIPVRVEAYDISTTGGQNSVGSMAVFENGMPANNQYRHFKIKSVIGINDYGSLREILSRRLKRAFLERNSDEIKGFGKLPNLILADGGIAHVGVIVSSLEDVELDIPVFGMVKDDKHKTRALISSDGEVIPLSNEAFRLVALIQNEVHRIAIEYHRKLNKRSIKSRLEEVVGIGAKRRKELFKSFGSIKAMKEATQVELQKVQGMNVDAAKNLYEFLHEH